MKRFYTIKDIKILKLPAATAPYNWEYGWVIDGHYSPHPSHSESECMQQAMDWIARYNIS